MKKVTILVLSILTMLGGVFISMYPQKASAAACSVSSATFSPSGDQADKWYAPGKNKVSIEIITENCIGQTLTVNVTEADSCPLVDCDDYLPDSGLENLKIKIEQIITNIDITAGEESCEAGLGFDCDLYLRVKSGGYSLYSSWEKSQGNLRYECSGVCLDNAKLGNIAFSEGTGPVNENGDPVSVTPTGNRVFDEDYKLLAPLPGISKIDSTTTTLGDYLNIIFKLAIGICGALAVIMIVIYGVQYMGDGSVFGHTEAKSKISAAIMGLLLALGAYAILNTINPDLVGESGINIKQVQISISPDDTSTGSSTNLCISSTNPPNPDDAKGTTVTLNKTMLDKYIPEINKITSLKTGQKLLMTAQTFTEGFNETPSPGTKSYRTNNPGNIGNTDDGKTKSFPTLKEGIIAQSTEVISGKGSYQINGSSTCALGKELYDGSLYQYLRIYSTGARQNNNYVNSIIGYFKANGKTITARTKMSEIYNMN